MTTVRGIAQNAKLGAVVLADDRVVYCHGLDHWPTDVVGTTVVVHGVLEQTDAYVTPSPHAAGASGSVWILREWTRD